MPSRADRASQPDPDAATHRTPAERVARQTGPDPTTTTSTYRRRLPYGQLAPKVLAHLLAYPHSAFTSWNHPRSWATRTAPSWRILVRLTAAGTVDQISERPARFRHHT